MKIVTLAENTACREGIQAEHGLSYYIEALGKKILFDFGQTEAMLDNAGAMGIDLGQVDLAVLSHGHYDHCGGLPGFLLKNAEAKVYMRPPAVDKHQNAAGKDIGVGVKLAPERVIFAPERVNLCPGMALVALCAPPEDNGGMTAFVEGRWMPEDFRHEQYLLLEENGKRVLISGCSHKGVVQIAASFRPDVLIGGFHLMKVEDEAVLDRAAERLLELPGVYYTGHCTGEKQFGYLKGKMKDRLHYLAAGSVLEI